MDGPTAAGPELERAARLVLGRGLGSGVDPDALRRAFRRRALELHPDRAHALGRDPRDLAEEFQALRRAFELLRGQPPGAASAPRPGRPARTSRAAAPMPPRPLRFAEYLYYAGRISWSDLAEAIAWQRRAGRRIGQWFVERGLLAPADVPAVRDALARHNASRRRAG
jgi:hypothetical protein